MALDGSQGTPVHLPFVLMLQDVTGVYLNGWHARNVQEFFMCFSSIRKVEKMFKRHLFFSKCLWINKYIISDDLLSKVEEKIINLVKSGYLMKGWHKMPH